MTAPTATIADALATALMVLGPENGLALLERLPGCAAYLVSKDLEIVTSSHSLQGLTYEILNGGVDKSQRFR